MKPQRNTHKLLTTVLGLCSILLFNSCGLFTYVPYWKAQKKAPYDVIIVPGFPYEEQPDLNTIYKVRLCWAYHLYTKGFTKNIIFSGGAVHSSYVEAKVMAEFATQMGIPREHIFVEDSAEHSTENLFYSYNLAKRNGWEKIAVTTDPFQSGMIAFLTTKDSLPVDFVPANLEPIIFKYWKMFKFNINDKEALQQENFVPLVERMDRKERLRGTHGDQFREGKD